MQKCRSGFVPGQWGSASATCMQPIPEMRVSNRGPPHSQPVAAVDFRVPTMVSCRAPSPGRTQWRPGWRSNMAKVFKFGIEEEFFLADAATKSAARAMPAAFLEAAKKATGGQVSGELLQAQVEIASLPHTDMATAREELRFLRQTLAEIAAEHGLAILAAGTHPTAAWSDMQQSSS